MKCPISFPVAGLLALVLGCAGEPAQGPDDGPAAKQPAATDAAGATGPKEAEPPKITNRDELREALNAKNPRYWGDPLLDKSDHGIAIIQLNDPTIRDISPLAGLPLEKLDLRGCSVADIRPLAGKKLTFLALEDTHVSDLSPLQGMPLVTLFLNNTPVEDIGPLEGAPLESLYLFGTRVSDLKPLAKVPTLQQLWLNRCPVRDISPLKGLPLVSLTLDETDVEDLSPLEGSSLQRLQIVDSKVTDLSVLKSMPQLGRLVFTPGRIKKGIDAARGVPKIGTSIDEAEKPGSAAAFWERYKAGGLK